ncbi:MAG TPA: hypothetical protein VIJ93_08910 [bacterium]
MWLHPAEFFAAVPASSGMNEAVRFSALTGVLVALELGIVEALSGGSIGIVALVTLLMLAGMPLLVTVGVQLWSHFVRLCGFLLGESLPLEPLRQVTAYSTAGLVALGVGWGLGKWLVLATFVFQFFGVEKVLRCSRWTAAVYVGLPFSIVAVLAGLSTLMFKVFK